MPTVETERLSSNLRANVSGIVSGDVSGTDTCCEYSERNSENSSVSCNKDHGIGPQEPKNDDNCGKDFRYNFSNSQKSSPDSLKIRHLTRDFDGFIFQIRISKRLKFSKSRRMLRTRIGSLSTQDARNMAAFLKMLSAGLFSVVEQHWNKSMLTEIEDEARLDAIEKHIFSRVTTEMREGADLVLNEPYQDPSRECEIVVGACNKIRQAITHLRSAPELEGLHQAAETIDSLEADQMEILGAYEQAKAKARDLAGIPYAETAQSNASTAFMFHSFMKFGTEVLGLGCEPDPNDHRGLHNLVKSIPSSVGQGVIIESTGLDAEAAEAIEEPVVELAKESHAAVQSEPETASNLEAVAVPTPALTEHPLFMNMIDRKLAVRSPSDFPTFSKAIIKYALDRAIVKSALIFHTIDDLIEAVKSGKVELKKDQKTSLFRGKVFVELIGDYPIDQYTFTDFQTFVNLLLYLPKNVNERKQFGAATIREILESQADLFTGSPICEPFALQTVRNGFVSTARSVINAIGKLHDTDFLVSTAGKELLYHNEFRMSRKTEPIGHQKMLAIFKNGVNSGFLLEAILPLLAFLTGRRIGLLATLRGRDIRPKFQEYSPDGNGRIIYVAQPQHVVNVDGRWKCQPIKNEQSAEYFVLHQFLVDIGFVQWAMGLGDQFIFPNLFKSDDPAGLASKRGLRLLSQSGCTGREVFHSMRTNYIDHARDENLQEHTLRQQTGHNGKDAHSKYGALPISEPRAVRISSLELPRYLRDNAEIFQNLDFDALRNKPGKNGTARV